MDDGIRPKNGQKGGRGEKTRSPNPKLAQNKQTHKTQNTKHTNKTKQYTVHRIRWLIISNGKDFATWDVLAPVCSRSAVRWCQRTLHCRLVFTFFFLYLLQLYSAASGDILPKDSGKYVNISRLAQDLHPDEIAPTVLIETDDTSLLIKDYDKTMVVALKCDREHIEE